MNNKDCVTVNVSFLWRKFKTILLTGVGVGKRSRTYHRDMAVSQEPLSLWITFFEIPKKLNSYFDVRDDSLHRIRGLIWGWDTN